MNAQPSPASPGLEPIPTRAPGRLWVAGWIAALVLRALWLALVHEPSRAVTSDMGGYLDRAREMFESARWSPYVFLQGAGYPALLGLLRRLWANDAELGVVTGWVQLALSLAALAGTVRLTREVAGRRWSGAALALGAVHVPWIFFTSVYLPETAYAVVLAVLGLALLRLARDPDARWRSTLRVGLAGAAAAWLKSLHLFVGPVAALVWLYPLRRGWRGSARILVGWFAGLALFLWLPHGALSLARSGRFLPSPPAGGLTFVMGKCPWKDNADSEGYRYWPPLEVQLGRQNTRTWPVSFIDQGFFVARGLECIAERPAVLVESLAGIPYLFLGNRLWPAVGCGARAAHLADLWQRLFSWPLVAGLALALGLGLVRQARPRGAEEGQRLAEVWLALAVPLLALFVMVWALISELRYRVPFDVLLLPLALWGWKESLGGLVGWLRARRATGAPAAGSGGPAPAAPAAPASPPGG